MKRLIAFILCMIIALSVIPFAASADGFDDVADGKWYTEGINFCVEKGYMAGVSDTHFDRNGTLTRAMFVTILAQVDGVNLTSYADRSVFGDVAVGKWYTGAITWAAENNLASGIGEGIFGYKNNVTREQMALFLYVYTEYKKLDTSASFDVSGFEDSGRIHDWAIDAVEWAVATGLISGTSDTILDPRGSCTRAQAAVIIRAFVLEFLSECKHRLPYPACRENVCSLCGETIPAAEHNYGEDGHCTYCGNSKPCEEHVWIPATCKDNGYCTVCYLVNPDEPDALGHDHDEKTKLCVRCNLYRDWTISKFEHIKKNIQINGISLADGSPAITKEFKDGTLHIFMRPNNDNDFFVQYWPNGNVTDDWKVYTGMVELKYNDSREIEFNMEINRDGEFMFSASGNFDELRDENFGGDYSSCTVVETLWNESEATDEEIYDIIYHFINKTMMHGGTIASQKLDTNLDIYDDIF